MMPKCDGLEVLKNIRFINKDKHQPYICMITALGLHKNISLFKEYKASSYVLKPFKIKTIYLMLDKYIKPLVTNAKKENIDEFYDFYENNTSEVDNKDNIETYNQSHEQISAQEFLKDYDDIHLKILF